MKHLTWNNPEHSGTYRNIREHKIKIMLIRKTYWAQKIKIGTEKKNNNKKRRLPKRIEDEEAKFRSGGRW